MDYVFDGDIFYFLDVFVADYYTQIVNNSSFNTTPQCISDVVFGGGFSDILEAAFWVVGVACSTGVSYKLFWVFRFF